MSCNRVVLADFPCSEGIVFAMSRHTSEKKNRNTELSGTLSNI